jgi:hypothetical protein
MYCATCLLIISIPGESVYDPVTSSLRNMNKPIILQNAQEYKVPQKYIHTLMQENIYIRPVVPKWCVATPWCVGRDHEVCRKIKKKYLN